MAENVKILLVDDDEFLLDMYSVKFQEAGFTLDIAANGEDALKKIKDGSYDVILLDIIMPGMDGFEVLQTVKRDKLAENSIIVILSNLGQKEDIERGMHLGADDYVIKAHFTPREVVEKIQSLLAKKKG